jgi:hypothetical protein
MALAITILALAAPAPHHHQPACDTVCQDRVAQHIRRRVRADHRQVWRHVTAPYRSWLRSTRMCESGGNYHAATGNGFWGAYQFTLESWAAVGGSGLPSDAEPLEQDYRAIRLLHLQGRGAWPVCG